MEGEKLQTNDSRARRFLLIYRDCVIVLILNHQVDISEQMVVQDFQWHVRHFVSDDADTLPQSSQPRAHGSKSYKYVGGDCQRVMPKTDIAAALKRSTRSSDFCEVGR